MKRMEAIELIARSAGDALIVSNIGYPSRELAAVCDRDENFYMLGSMGMASSIGLGLALARPERRVIALDGDGSILMNLGSLSTIACHGPDNYLLVILDNGVYGSTGAQPTPICARSDLASIARAAGVPLVEEARSLVELAEQLAKMNMGVLVVKTELGNANVPIIEFAPAEILERFMAAVRQSSDEFHDRAR
jgi:sulfopyruvate decarboxylase subunit beta